MARSETKRLKLVYIAVERIAIVNGEKFVIFFVKSRPASSGGTDGCDVCARHPAELTLLLRVIFPTPH